MKNRMFTEENEVIEDNTIVEFRYDITRPHTMAMDSIKNSI